MKKTALFVMIAGAVSFLPTVAEALCAQSVHVDRVVVLPGAGLSALYLRNSPITPTYWVAQSSDPKIIDAAVTALTSRTRVIVTGSAAQCPAPSLGAIIGIVLNMTVAP
jgi:hypothetical protein